MPISMKRAFNSRMLTNLTLYRQATGSYNEDNDWVSGTLTSQSIRGVVQTGNKFAQFDQGESVQNEEGGIRYENYLTLTVRSDYNVAMDNIIGHNGEYYNLLQKSLVHNFGYDTFLIEKSKSWSPT